MSNRLRGMMLVVCRLAVGALAGCGGATTPPDVCVPSPDAACPGNPGGNDAGADVPGTDAMGADVVGADVVGADRPSTGGVSSCNVTELGTSSRSQCWQWVVAHAAENTVHQAQCTQLGTGGSSMFSAGTPCDLTGAVAGCVNSDGTVTTWFFPPYTMGSVAAACRGTVVAP